MKDFTSKYTDNDEEKILLRKINDLIKKSERTCCVTYSHFLTPAEQTLISSAEEFYGYIGFDGGYENAERRICRISESEYCCDNGLPIEIYSVTAGSAEFSHRDILGSLMGLGIKRETIGDIIVCKNKTQFLCHSSVAEFIEFNLKKVGRFNIEIKKDSLSEISEIKTEETTINISSMRIDSVAAETFGISRTKAADFIKRGTVSLNWLICTDVSQEVKLGDKISLRGKGKAEIGEVSGTSKKGRLFVKIKKYI